MKASIIRIGNSQGVRIPKVFLEQAQLTGEVELVVQDRQIIISPAAGPRQDWAMKFRSMARLGEDRLLDAGSPAQTSWDEDEWEW